MAKNINMTRERKIALPVILAAAADLVNGTPVSDKQKRAISDALAAFKDN